MTRPAGRMKRKHADDIANSRTRISRHHAGNPQSEGFMTDETEPNKYRFYLYDLGPIIIERALEAKASKKAAQKESPDYEYAAGRLMAFNEVISIMQQQAEGFDIPLEEMKLKGI